MLACCSRVEGLRLVVVSAGEHPPHFGRRGDGRDSARRLRLCDAHARALAHAAARHAAGGRSRPLDRTRSALAAPTSAPGLTGLTPPTSAPGLGSPHPHLRRDWLTPPTIRAGAGPLVASSKGQVRLGPVIASAGITGRRESTVGRYPCAGSNLVRILVAGADNSGKKGSIFVERVLISSGCEG